MSVSDAVPLRLCLFGPFEVRVSGQPLPRLRFRKSPAVLALLALRSGGRYSISQARGGWRERDWLAGLLWPEGRDTQSLRNCCTDLHGTFDPKVGRFISRAGRTLSLDRPGVSVGALAFKAALARRDPLSPSAAVSRSELACRPALVPVE